eukprot:393075-Heterocapsa_arctica.AAC.1
MKSIRWVKAHLNKSNATKAGVCFDDWYGNNEADVQAKSGAATHGYTESHNNAIKERVYLAKLFKSTCSETTSYTFNTP